MLALEAPPVAFWVLLMVPVVPNWISAADVVVWIYTVPPVTAAVAELVTPSGTVSARRTRMMSLFVWRLAAVRNDEQLPTLAGLMRCTASASALFVVSLTAPAVGAAQGSGSLAGAAGRVDISP